MDLGAGRRGVDMGPSALRLARLGPTLAALGHRVDDLGNIEVPIAEATASPDDVGARFVASIADVTRRLADAVASAASGAIPVVLGGDHAVSMGSIAGVVRRARGARVGVLWIDAHADLNTPQTSPSGNVHGMPLAHLLGHGDPRLLAAIGTPPLHPRDVAFLGLRSVDPAERAFIHAHGLTAWTMSDLDRIGMAAATEAALAVLAHVDHLHVSFDADALDPAVAPGVGTPVAGGLGYREAHLLMELLASSGRVGSVDLVEVNPILDERNASARVMVELAASLFGRTIL
jgi:arginase